MLNSSNFETVEVEFNSSNDLKKDVGKECLLDITQLPLHRVGFRISGAPSHRSKFSFNSDAFSNCVSQ